jgi:hypothetical protein
MPGEHSWSFYYYLLTTNLSKKNWIPSFEGMTMKSAVGAFIKIRVRMDSPFRGKDNGRARGVSLKVKRAKQVKAEFALSGE